MLFTGVNNLGKTIILVGSFIVKEDYESYKFTLNSFEEFFGQPTTVMTDQDPALKLAISKEWSFTHHLFCIFHIYRNIQKKVAQYLGKNNEKFLKEFSCIQKIDQKEEFEEEWKSFVTSYCEPPKTGENENLDENSILEIQSSKSVNSDSEEEFYDEERDRKMKESKKQVNSKQKLKCYLENLYKSRKSWVKCYTFQHFGAGQLESFFYLFYIGMLSTQRNESMNNALKKRIKHYKRTNALRIIAIVSDMIDNQYHEVYVKIIFNNFIRT